MSDTSTTVPEAEEAQTARPVTGEIQAQERPDPPAQEPARRFVPTFRRRPEPVPPVDGIVSRASSVMERVAATSISEVDALIKELEQLRDFLRQESGRIQREIEGYARLSEEATKSTKIIAESVGEWKNALENMAGRRL
jgi:hypothetical protein